LGPVPVALQQIYYYIQELAQLRTANADFGPSWSDPMPDFEWYVSGTFGEWRGDNNTYSHYGVDLATGGTTAINVRASRGGVISRQGLVSTKPMGNYLVIDHGCGFFSGYLHLDINSIVVKEGQVVARGDTLATNLFARTPAQVKAYGRWGTHLHFEIRTNAISAWGVGKPGGAENTKAGPGTAQDPILTSGIFAIPSATALPQIDMFGLTGQAPWQTVFQKAAPSGNGSSLVYLFVKTSDRESLNNPGPRSVSFWPERAALPQTITPSNAVLIASYLPSGTDGDEGFALYDIRAYNKAKPSDYFRYWFMWDTSSYAANRIGPRSFTNSVQGYSGLTTNYTFTFGPRIKGAMLTPLVPQQYTFTNVAYLGTNLLANRSLPDPNFSQPDQYLIQIINTTNGQPLNNVTWSPPLSNGYSSLFSVHTNEQAYTFTLPPNFDPLGLKLRVSSRLAPDIADEVCLCSAANMVFIPAGSFTMGNCMDPSEGSELPLHTVYVSAFCMGQYPVTKCLWDTVYQWAIAHGYTFDYAGSGKASTHPVQTIDWYDCVKWCNARSEKEGKTPAYYTDAAQTMVYRSGEVDLQTNWVNWSVGYRLPTEAEREKAARGGASGQRFP
jgi:murein DD-endopeptidase MepM/ murein hydrolase activator NlpD